MTIERLADPLNAEALGTHGLRGLHVGCGGVMLEGFLNTDKGNFKGGDGTTTEPGLLTLVNGRYYLEHDSTNPMPIEDEVFDCVYAEAFIEHITPGAAITWLTDMRRVLKPDGYVRLSTPDLRKYVNGYLDPEGTFYEEHRNRLDVVTTRMFTRRAGREAIEMLRREYFAGETVAPARRAFLINQIFRFWGHKWIYDLDELRHVAVEAGFPAEGVVERAFRQGRDPAVAGLDDEEHNDESIYVEFLKA